MRRIRGKKGAIELSMTTIVVVVLALTLLIMGFVLIRNIMCGAIDVANGVTDSVKEEVTTFFSNNDADEIYCIGQGRESASLFPGEENYVSCVLRPKETTTYEFRFIVDESFSTLEPALIKRWLVEDRKVITGTPGDDEPRKVTKFNIPDDAPEGEISLKVQVKKSGSTSIDLERDLGFTVTRKGLVRSVVC